jgi:hypothetical protein
VIADVGDRNGSSNQQQASDNVDVIGKYLGTTVYFCGKHDRESESESHYN